MRVCDAAPASDLVYVVCPVGVYEPPVEGSALTHIHAAWESHQMFGELCTQLWMVSQPVAEIITRL